MAKLIGSVCYFFFVVVTLLLVWAATEFKKMDELEESPGNKALPPRK